MSTAPRAGNGKITVPDILARKSHPANFTEHKIVSLTAYDTPTARLVDEAGADIILVGDSLAMVVLGYETTLPVTIEEMLHHTRAVRRGVRRALLVADMPFGSYHADTADSLRHAVRFIKEAGAEAVKVEGGERRMELIARLVEAEIPVMGHIGLTPQSFHAFGGFRVQGKTVEAAEQLFRDARAVFDRAGVHAARAGRPDHARAANPHHRHRRRPRLRRPNSRAARYDRPGRGACSQVCPAVRQRGRGHFARRRRICRRRS
jgi:3-methyl-2-oxobutanoate hydroxymethyltransferase